MESMIPENFIKEQLSLAYVRAVVFRAGFDLWRPEVDHGIDGTIEDSSRNGITVNRVDFQLKATTRHSVRESEIAYDLLVKNYNKLIHENGLPCVLILFVMPRDEARWLRHSEEKLCLQKCAYWVSLMGKVPSRNSSTVTVLVPLANVFNGDGLQKMFNQLIG